MNKYWLITDTHFGHENMVKKGYRPDGYEELLFYSLMAIPNDDILIHLGDVGLASDSTIHEKYIWPLRCIKILVRGNHDHKSNSWYLNNGWDFVCEQFMDRIYGRLILFSHIPQPDIGYDINIHGHLHDDDHRLAQILAIKNDKQKLMSMEQLDYKTVTLKSFINA